MLACQIIGGLTIRPAAEPLGRQLVFTAKALREAFEATLADAGGSLGAWAVLNALSEEGVVNQSFLASRAQIDGATITHHIDRLEALGLVRRRTDPADRRVRRIELTPAGTALHRRMLAAARRFEAETVGTLTERQQEELRRSLTRLRAALDTRRRPAAKPLARRA